VAYDVTSRLYRTSLTVAAPRMESKVDLELLELMLANPECSYDHAGQYFGVTRERIRQLLMDHFEYLYEGREAYAIWVRQQKMVEKEKARQARMETVECPICRQPFDRTIGSARPKKYDTADCRTLHNTYLRYYLQFDQHQVSNARTTIDKVIEDPYLLEDGKWRARYYWAKRTLEEYDKYGYISRKRTINHKPPKRALALAKKIGIDLDETRERLLKEAGISLEPWEQGQ
jgi:hypothetical protein